LNLIVWIVFHEFLLTQPKSRSVYAPQTGKLFPRLWSPGIHVWVILDTSAHVFQWQPFTLIRVLYGYDLHSHKLFLRRSCFLATCTS